MAITVKKRSGETALYDSTRVRRAALRSLNEAYGPPELNEIAAGKIAALVYDRAAQAIGDEPDRYPNERIGVEEISDIVEEELMRGQYFEAARLYILYREEHRKLRESAPVPPEVKAAFAADDAYFPTPIQKFQFYDKYSRFNQELGRRETWVETVDRCVDFLDELTGHRLPQDVKERIRRGILTMDVMPSMRLLAMAGAPARRNSMAIYNCAFMAIDDLAAFHEALLISMAGCGVGFSVERKYVDKLPVIAEQNGYHAGTYVVDDSAEGWAHALEEGLHRWMFGHDIDFDTSLVRPAGSVLATKGGRASGPGPLREMLESIKARILSRQGQKLRPIDAHDIMCMIGQAAVSGGVRRTAMISLFDEDDREMLTSKAPGFDQLHKYRWNANNSAVRSASTLDDQQEFAARFMEMVAGGNGEPGIFSRDVAQWTRPSRRLNGDFGTNPCAEIILRSQQFCNLSAAVVRSSDTFETLREKVILATIIGTIQSCATNFPGMRPRWKLNCEEERLLGVDITGQQDNPSILTEEAFVALREAAVAANVEYADWLGIARSAAITCVKPSGNTSQLVNCASGLHARWAPYYIRNVRVSASSPLALVLKDAGVPLAPENGDDPLDPRTWVASFPVASPPGAVTRNDRSAVEQLDWWLRNKASYTEHNPSVTITYRSHEVIDLMLACWEARELLAGVSFLPSFDAAYDQLPYIEITKQRYDELVAAFPEIDFSRVYHYERTDLTTAAQELACVAGLCEV